MGKLGTLFVACMLSAEALAGCAQPKSPADLAREQERKAAVDKVLARLKERRRGLRPPELMENAQSTADDDAMIVERGECTGDDCIKLFMRHAMHVLSKEFSSTIVTGYTLPTTNLETMTFPPDLERTEDVRVVIGIAHPPKGDNVYRVLIGVELIGKNTGADFSR